jgi:tRNA modification GTPase
METIFALSSGGVPAGVAVIRMSGPLSGTALAALCGALPDPRRAAYRAIRDPGDGSLIDKALVLWFPGPATETGEDMAEFQVHGSPAVVRTLLAVLGGFEGARLALPGEFVRRAFASGKLDLTQAEGLADLVAAETKSQLDQALSSSSGTLRKRCEAWRDRVVGLRAAVEARLDFSDEGDVGALPDALVASAHALADEIAAACAGYGSAELVRRGYRVALLGLPNAGKSSLLNAIAGRDVAIVTPEAGTTRDVLEVAVDLGGHKVVFLDTAGIREADSVAEREGVRRAKTAGADCDLALWLDDLSEAPSAPQVDGSAVLAIGTKADLANGALRLIPAVSAVTGQGIDALLSTIRERAAEGAADRGIVVRERQHRALAAAVEMLKQVGGTAQEEIVAELLRSAGDAIGAVSGQVGAEQVLDRIFSEFCIGK